MKLSLALLLSTISVMCLAQTQQIRSGATVYIAPMGGYESYLAAAFVKKHVPFAVVTDKTKAEYIITSTVAHNDLTNGQPAVVVNNRNTAVGIGNATGETPGANIRNAMEDGYSAGAAERRALGETTTSISLIDVHSSQIVFAHAAGKKGTNQLKKTAEDCANQLKNFIDKSEKKKR